MSRRRAADTSQGDLFGAARAVERDPTPVTLPMEPIGPGTHDAWLLRPAGSTQAPKFGPRKLVKRAQVDGRDFTMPRFVALERGWL